MADESAADDQALVRRVGAASTPTRSPSCSTSSTCLADRLAAGARPADRPALRADRRCCSSTFRLGHLPAVVAALELGGAVTYRWLDDLDDALDAGGVAWVAVPFSNSDPTGAAGWWERGRPASTGQFDVTGVLCHHTASPAGCDAATDLRVILAGNSDAPGPISQLYVDRGRRRVPGRRRPGQPRRQGSPARCRHRRVRRHERPPDRY